MLKNIYLLNQSYLFIHIQNNLFIFFDIKCIKSWFLETWMTELSKKHLKIWTIQSTNESIFRQLYKIW